LEEARTIAIIKVISVRSKRALPVERVTGADGGQFVGQSTAGFGTGVATASMENTMATIREMAHILGDEVVIDCGDVAKVELVGKGECSSVYWCYVTQAYVLYTLFSCE
jgi:hypothetical protein